MNNRRLSQGILVAALLAALPLTDAWATHRSQAEQAIAEAKAAHAQAASVNAASEETAKMIEQAENLLPSRQYTKALGIAEQAKKEDDYAYDQATAAAPADDRASEDAEAAIEAAEAAREKAASIGGEWRDTAQMIEDAQGLAKSGQFADAIELANAAKRQGELGYKQAMREKDADFPDYVMHKG